MRWLSVRTAKAGVGTQFLSTTATALKRAVRSGVRSRLRWSVGGVTAKAMFLVASILLLVVSCASAPKVGPCMTLECGVVCCNNDGKVCEGCHGRGIPQSRGDAEGSLPSSRS